MQKKLLSTTALVAAGALTVPFMATQASAAEPLSLSVGGYFSTGMQFSSQDDGAGEPAANIHDVSIHTDGEVQFTASTTLDNGIEVAVRIEYEAQNQGGGSSIVDERYVTFSGDFGRLRMGSDDPAAAVMQYQAPVGAYQMGVNSPTFAVPNLGSAFTAFSGSYPTTYADWSNDAGNIIYYSPRMSGFQLGLSYQPDGSRAPVDNIAFIPGDQAGGQKNVISAAANYVNSFNGVDVSAAIGYVHGTEEISTANSDDRQSISGALVVGFSGFSVGGSILHDNHGMSNDGNSLTWDVGATYSTGPWTVGVTYLHEKQETGTGNPNFKIDAYLVSGTYNLGPGVDLWAGIKYVDNQYNDDASQENKATFGMVGTTVSF